MCLSVLSGEAISSQPTSSTRISGFRGADLSLFAGGSQSVVVICHSTYEPGGGGHMCRFTYVRVNVSWMLILQSLH